MRVDECSISISPGWAPASVLQTKDLHTAARLDRDLESSAGLLAKVGLFESSWTVSMIVSPLVCLLLFELRLGFGQTRWAAIKTGKPFPQMVLMKQDPRGLLSFFEDYARILEMAYDAACRAVEKDVFAPQFFFSNISSRVTVQLCRELGNGDRVPPQHSNSMCDGA